LVCDAGMSENRFVRCCWASCNLQVRRVDPESAGTTCRTKTNEPKRMNLPHAIVVCGVAGSGKSTVAKGLADALGAGFRLVEGDSFHPSSNVAKMKRGEPLTDEDRVEWLTRISESIAGSSGPMVVACSALRAAHRERILAGLPSGFRIEFVMLNVDKSTARRRIEQRSDHFFPSSLVDSQFDALEIADDVRVVQVTDDGVDVVVSRVLGFYRCE